MVLANSVGSIVEKGSLHGSPRLVNAVHQRSSGYDGDGCPSDSAFPECHTWSACGD